MAKHRDVTRLVVLDTNQEYGPLLAEAYVNARQIRDLYHIIKLAHKCRDAVRINIWRDATGEARRILYDKRHFWSKLEDPDPFKSESIFLFDNPLPKLFKANELFKSFVGIFAVAKDTADAQQLFELWTVKANDMLEYFGTFIETVRKHYDEIFAYPEEAATNGIAEAQNRSIRATINQGRRFGWRGAANKMACKMEVTRQRSAEYLLDIASSDHNINIEEDDFNGLSKTALKHLQRAIRLQTSNVTEIPAGDSAAELSVDASLLRSKRMAEIAGKRKPRIDRKSKDSGDD